MRNARALYSLTLFAALFAAGCGSDPTDETESVELAQWLADTSNGASVELDVAGVRLRAMYLPEDYMAHLYLRNNEHREGMVSDSVSNAYGSSIAFALAIRPTGTTTGVRRTTSVDQGGESDEQTMLLNFGMRDFLRLEYRGRSVEPALALLQNDGFPGGTRTLLVVFPKDPSWASAASASLTFDDRVFLTGINRFTFSVDALRSAPSLTLQRK